MTEADQLWKKAKLQVPDKRSRRRIATGRPRASDNPCVAESSCHSRDEGLVLGVAGSRKIWWFGALTLLAGAGASVGNAMTCGLADARQTGGSVQNGAGH